MCSVHFKKKYKYDTPSGISNMGSASTTPEKYMISDEGTLNIKAEVAHRTIKTEFVAVPKFDEKSSYSNMENKSYITNDNEYQCNTQNHTQKSEGDGNCFSIGECSYKNNSTFSESENDSVSDSENEAQLKTKNQNMPSKQSSVLQVQQTHLHKIKILKQQVLRLRRGRANLKGVIQKFIKTRNINNLTMQKDHTLYGDLTSPPVRFVLLTASLLETNLKFEHIDLFKSENKTEFYRQINPLEKVPTLVIGNETINDSHAIALYLCESNENQTLYPKDNLFLKARVDEMLFFNATTLFPADSAVYTDFFSGQWPASDSNLADWYAGLDYLEHRLCKFKWLSGDQMFLSDVCCSTTVSSLSIIVPIPDKYENIKKWMQRLEKIPSYKINMQGLDRLRSYVDRFRRNMQAIDGK